ncbi:VIR_N domain-containing protein isoform 2-T2 [Glossina fuscipes fuscipes]
MIRNQYSDFAFCVMHDAVIVSPISILILVNKSIIKTLKSVSIMGEAEDISELLFFDTFSHEIDTDINLDLVQFPKPVYITQVRIIPLGARVQADFPGGVRLGATNPSKFEIEFFVNDLDMTGASTFETLGQLQYNQNDCIHLECNQKKIPTDGLVLRGWYGTITLAVYGILTNSLTENIASPPPIHSEPEVIEELNNLSNEGIDVDNLKVVDNLKDEWKENELSHRVAAEYDCEAADYEGLRSSRGGSGTADAHYCHDSNDERDRERRLRKVSKSSEHSPTTSHIRTRSEGNELEYRECRERDRECEKLTRDWSRSPPDYSRHSRHKRTERSRSDIEESHKWPRTPPISADSPLRPHSPDYSDDEMDGRYKHMNIRSFRCSTDSLNIRPSSVAAAAETPETHVIDDDENPGTPLEQYEPILSDDEIIDDEADEGSNALNEDQTVNDDLEAKWQIVPAIITFDVYEKPLQKFTIDFQEYYQMDVENLKAILEKFDTQTNCTSLEEFSDVLTNQEQRECFVYLCEQLINQLSFISKNIKRRNYVLQQLCECKKRLKRIFHILRVALNFDSASAQTQPVFKIRHIKVGAKLMELLAPCQQLFEYLLQVEKYDPFQPLLSLLNQIFMALSIKLLLLKAMYALMDTKPALQHFLAPEVKGYSLLLGLLQQTQLTRSKYALQSLIKKLHLNEALLSIQETCMQLFVSNNFDSSIEESYQLMDSCIQQLIDAFTKNSLFYQQPRRFLPVSKKFEISLDKPAQRSFANTLQSYLKQHSLGESLLLLISNATNLPSYLLLNITDLLIALMKTGVGLDYLVDDCFETTQLIVSTLLGIESSPKEFEGGENNLEADVVIFPKSGEVATDIAIEKENPITDSTTSSTVITSPSLVDKLETPVEQSKEETEVSTSLANNVVYHKEEIQLNKTGSSRLQQLGMELAYKVQTRYHLDAIVYYSSISNDYDSIALACHLHSLYSQTCSVMGRQHTVEVLGLNNHLQIFLNLIQKEQHLQAQRQLVLPGAKYKSPVLSYAVDMVDCCVRYCENLEYLIEHGNHILELAKNHDTFEPSVSAVLQEMFVYLKPLEARNIFAYNDIGSLVEVINRSLEYITTFPGDLIMGLRILRLLAISPNTQVYKSVDTQELKHRYVALQFYAADGLQVLIRVLEKIYTYYEQPGLHAPVLMTLQGLHCCQIILPTLQIMREMLSFAIQCRDADFKDLTAIDHLMKTYNLLHYFPKGSQAAIEVESAKQEIIQTFLAYTQPNEQDEESLHKSLWTQMIREVLKNIDSPASFIPGLLVLAELLPLPLPAPLPTSNSQISSYTLKTQAQRLITERKLWSAHLHPQSAQIARLVENIAPTSFPQLSDLLARTCLQLSDLAPNMTLLISKTLSDLLTAEWRITQNQPTVQLARLLQFYARLNAYASLKISTLSILTGKLWELFQDILALKCDNEFTMKCQISVHRILESFLDTEISFIATTHLFSSIQKSNQNLNLASALPPKELIPRIVEAIFNNLMSAEVTQEVSALGVRNLVILTEHDITFYHLALILKQKSSEFQRWMLKIIELNESGSYNSNVESLVLLLRSLTQIEELNQSYPTLPVRILKLSPNELACLIGFKADNEKTNLMQRILAILQHHKEEVNDTLRNDIQQLKELMCGVDVKASAHSMELEDVDIIGEPVLPQTESIVTQYDGRPIFCTYEPISDDEQMSASYWLRTLCINDFPAEDFNIQYERVVCDLSELAQECLASETNLSSECKRVLHLSGSPQSNRERTPTAPCFRTRRVEVEPSTGRPEKKIFISSVRGRGFARTAPSRGDLFRSRPPNTSRPPSLHVDDFLALETCGAQPTGPTGYNKIPPLIRGARVGRNRGSRIAAAAVYKAKILRTSSPSTWNKSGSSHFSGVEAHYNTSHFIGRSRGRGMRARPYLR